MAVTLHWTADGISPQLAQALRTLGAHYPLREGDGNPRLRFSHRAEPGGLRVTRTGEDFEITYAALSDALRGLGAALSGWPEDGGVVAEQCPFQTLGIMLDCSRNAVMTAEHVKSWLRQLALLGYTMAMLYTEDTYSLPDEPFFGIFRGAYSEAELREVDDYAARLGIELIGCIQTLGHLERMLQWSAYAQVRDTERELFVGEPATYQLIAKMVGHFARCLRSRRIHIGMDETWTLGRGRFLDIVGHRSGYEILTRHLTEVVGICDQHDLRPMIWSDMFFKFGGDMGVDYDVKSAIPDEVKQAIPPGLDLVYWDYAGSDEARYLSLIERHRALGREPLMASGVWTWLRLWYSRSETEAFARPCVRACKQAGLSEVFFTMWGDDGGYCEFDSALAGLAFTAAECYGEDETALRRRFAAVCGAVYDQVLLACQVEYRPAEPVDPWSPDSAAAATLWDDPLLAMHWLGVRARHPGHWEAAHHHYRRLCEELAPCRDVTAPVDIAHAHALAALLAAKIEFRQRLEAAYQGKDRAALQSLLADVPRMVALVDGLEASFRRQWLRRNKPYGLETIQIRVGGLRQRYLEAGRLIEEILAGRREAIAELDDGLALPKEVVARLTFGAYYQAIATPGVL